MCYWLRRQQFKQYWLVTKRWCGLLRTVPSMLRLTALNHDKTEFARLIDDRLAQLLIAHVVEFARQADFGSLDPLAAQNAFFLQRRNGGRHLTSLHRTRQDRLRLIHETFGGYVCSGGNCTRSKRETRFFGG